MIINLTINDIHYIIISCRNFCLFALFHVIHLFRLRSGEDGMFRPIILKGLISIVLLEILAGLFLLDLLTAPVALASLFLAPVVVAGACALCLRRYAQMRGGLMHALSGLSKGELDLMRDNTAGYNDRLLFGEIDRIYGTTGSLISKISGTLGRYIISAQVLNEASASLADSAHDQASMAEEVSSAMEEFSSAAELVGERMDRTSGTLREITGSLKSFSAAIEDTSFSMSELGNLSNRTVENAGQCEAQILSFMEGMESIKATTARITEFTTIISDIVEQTNLLSLNASIEAARAGETGRGFAVVAKEISKLADRTLKSSQEVGQLVAAMVRTVGEGAQRVSEASRMINTVIDDVRSFDSLTMNVMSNIVVQSTNSTMISSRMNDLSSFVEDVTASAREQKNASREVAQMMENVSISSQSLSANSEDLARLSAELLGTTQEMRECLSVYSTAAIKNEGGTIMAAEVKGKFITLAGHLMSLFKDGLSTADQELYSKTGRHFNELDPEGWYDTKIFNTFMETYARVSPLKEKAIVNLGRMVYPTIQKTVGLPKELKSPLDFILFEAEGFLDNHRGSDVVPRKFLKKEEKNVVVQAPAPGYNPKLFEGVFYGILEMNGIRNGKVELCDSGTCEFRITW